MSTHDREKQRASEAMVSVVQSLGYTAPELMPMRIEELEMCLESMREAWGQVKATFWLWDEGSDSSLRWKYEVRIGDRQVECGAAVTSSAAIDGLPGTLRVHKLRGCAVVLGQPPSLAQSANDAPCDRCDGTGWAAEANPGTGQGGRSEQIGAPCPRGCPADDDGPEDPRF